MEAVVNHHPPCSSLSLQPLGKRSTNFFPKRRPDARLDLVSYCPSRAALSTAIYNTHKPHRFVALAVLPDFARRGIPPSRIQGCRQPLHRVPSWQRKIAHSQEFPRRSHSVESSFCQFLGHTPNMHCLYPTGLVTGYPNCCTTAWSPWLCTTQVLRAAETYFGARIGLPRATYSHRDTQ